MNNQAMDTAMDKSGLSSQIGVSPGRDGNVYMDSEKSHDSEEMSFEQFKKMKQIKSLSPRSKKKVLKSQKSHGVIEQQRKNSKAGRKADEFVNITSDEDDKNATDQLKHITPDDSSNALIVEP